MGMWENVCLTVLLFDGLSVHPFACSYSFVYVSVRLSVYQFEYYLFMCPSVRVSVRPPVCIFCVILFVTISLNVFFRSFVRPNVRPSCRLPSE